MNLVLCSLNCPECGVSGEEGKKVGKVFCSKECMERSRRRILAIRRGSGGKSVCVCAACSTEFTSIHKRKYCSDRCTREVENKAQRQSRVDNPEKAAREKQRSRDYVLSDTQREKKKQRDRVRRLNSPEESRAARSRRRAALRGAKHPDHDRKRERWLHKLANRLQRITGEKWHVDHIVPIKAGGLHHHDNLQVIPAKWNMQKNANPYWRPTPCPPWFKAPNINDVMNGGIRR